MLPNVRINVTEEVNLTTSKLNTFLPLVILKTKTGPIGQEVLVKSAKAFTDTFGIPDSATPEAFGLLQYIKAYGNAYVVRVAADTAAYASGTIKSGNVNLITITSKYKTDSLNGVEVALNYSGTENKLYISATINNKLITSIKETINFSIATAVDVENALDKVVDSFNDAQNGLVLTNAFVDKTVEDDKPETLDESATVTGGVSGNTSIPNSAVISLIDNYEGSDLGIDAILTPGFEDVEVVRKLANVADNSSFMAIASITGTSAITICATAASYPSSASLAIYAGSVYLTADPTIAVPACVAILPAYITKDKSSKWLAPAGVTRGTLELVSDLVTRFSDSDLEDMYVNSIPVNGIKKIAGRGFIVWGQKTAEQETKQYEDRINVVRLIKYLTKEVYNISYDYLFEPITSYTYNSWILRVEAILEDIKMGNGLSEYKVIMDDTLNTEETKKQNKLIGLVRFKPLEAAEFVEINFVVTDDVEEEE